MGLANFDRQRWFDGIGTNVSTAASLEEVMNLSGLNFGVEKLPMACMIPTINGETGEEEQTPLLVPNQYVTYNTLTHKPIGPVGKNYNIMTNEQSFDFLENIIRDTDAVYDTAGNYDDGSKSFISIKLPDESILGEMFGSYICFLNSFDGTGSIRCLYSNLRLFCSNTIQRALRNSQYKISIRHSNSLQSRLENAKLALQGQANYTQQLKLECESLAKKTFTFDQFKDMVYNLYPINSEDTKIIQERQTQLRDYMIKAYNAEDLQNHTNTAYRAYQAAADVDSHPLIFRHTKAENMAGFKSLLNGSQLFNVVADRLVDMV